jgi:hypothetical protein
MYNHLNMMHMWLFYKVRGRAEMPGHHSRQIRGHTTRSGGDKGLNIVRLRFFCELVWKVHRLIATNFLLFIYLFILFICACNVWVISSPFPHPFPSLHPLRPPSSPPIPSLPSRNYFALISNFVEQRV